MCWHSRSCPLGRLVIWGGKPRRGRTAAAHRAPAAPPGRLLRAGSGSALGSCAPRRGAAFRPHPGARPRRGAPSGAPSPARCGWRSPAPRLTLQLGRRLAIGLKIAASPPPQAPGARSRPAARSRRLPARLGSCRPRSRHVRSPPAWPLARWRRRRAPAPTPAPTPTLGRFGARRGHAAPGRPVQHAGR